MKYSAPLVAFPESKGYQYTPTELQQVTADYYSAIKISIFELISKAHQYEKFGRNSNDIYNAINDYNYLYTLLLIISDEMRKDREYNEFIKGDCPDDNGIDYYMEKYNMNCIIKRFFCNGTGYDIKNLLSLFGLSSSNSEQDGIGFMHIQYNRAGRCLGSRKQFRVF